MLADRVRMSSGGKKTIKVNVYATPKGYVTGSERIYFYSLKKPINNWEDFADNLDDYIKDTYDITNTSINNTVQVELEPTNKFIYGHNSFVIYDTVYINNIQFDNIAGYHALGYILYNGNELRPWELRDTTLQNGDTICIEPYFD